jgi:peptidoglycan/xylan/chitin deacetylase (PgdA/CDA1 family)
MKLTIIQQLICALFFMSAQTRASVYNQCVNKGMFAMTWSDGPTLNIPALLTTLQAKNVKVSFHFVTKYLTDPNVQSIVQQTAAAGHLIGLRSETDWNLLTMSSADITSNIVRLAGVMAQFSGTKPTFIALPAGGYDSRVVAAVEAAGMIIVAPNLDSMDYNGDATQILNAFSLAISLQADGQGNFISVQRDGVLASVQDAGAIIDLVKSHKYQFVMLDACVGNVAPPAATTYVTTTSTAAGGKTSTQTVSAGGTVGQVTSAGESSFATQFAVAQLILGVIGMLLLTL